MILGVAPPFTSIWSRSNVHDGQAACAYSYTASEDGTVLLNCFLFLYVSNALSLVCCYSMITRVARLVVLHEEVVVL